MARMFHSIIVAKSTAFWYCQILSVLCRYDMGSISLRTARMQIARICNGNVTKCGGRRPLSTLADWNFIRRKVKIAYEVRGFRLPKNCKGSRKKVDDWKQ